MDCYIMDRKTYSRDIYSKYWITARESNSFSKGLLEYEKNMCDYISKQISKGGKLLDVAIGTGYPFGYFLQRAGYRVNGIDIAPILIEKCQELFPNINCHVGDAEDLEYPDNYFDCVYCFNATFYFTNLNKALDEMLRVTKEEGLVIFDIKNSKNKAVAQNYKKSLSQNKGIGRIARYVKNIVKIFLPNETPLWDWNAPIHEVPTDPKTVKDYLENKNIDNYQIMAKKGDGTLEKKYSNSSFEEYERLVFSIRK